MSLSGVLLVPDLRDNLLSIAKITDNNFEVTFKKDHAVVIDRDGNVKLRADRVDNLYYLREQEHAECKKISNNMPSNLQILETWHRRLGYFNIID